MVAGMAGPLNAIKRTVIDGKSVILLDGPPQVRLFECFFQTVFDTVVLYFNTVDDTK